MTDYLPSNFYEEEFWSKIEQLESVDTEYEKIFTEVGKVCSNWEYVEIHLSYVFEVLVEAQTPASMRVYGTLTGTSMRKSAILAAAEAFFSYRPNEENLRLNLKKLLNVYIWAANLRGNIVHGIVIGKAGKKHLYPPSYNSKKTYYIPTPSVNINSYFDISKLPYYKQIGTNSFKLVSEKYLYTSTQLSEFAERFVKIWMAFDRLWRDLAKLVPEYHNGQYT